MGVIIDEIKYIKLCHPNDFKKQSLYDNLYFTLKDIFLNSVTYDDCVKAALYLSEITDGVNYEKRTDDFKYANLLEKKNYVEKLLSFFRLLKKEDSFEFSAPEEDDEVKGKDVKNSSQFMLLDDWWIQFEHLISLLEELV